MAWSVDSMSGSEPPGILSTSTGHNKFMYVLFFSLRGGWTPVRDVNGGYGDGQVFNNVRVCLLYFSRSG